MGTPYMGEIRVFSFGFAPKGWALCNGQTLPIAQNQALYALLGTTYGGNGQTTFALPNFTGRMPMHFGNGFALGQSGGETAHTLIAPETAHGHVATGMTGPRVGTNPAGAVLASGDMFGAGPATAALAPTALDSVGASQPHPNMQPYLALNVCIALQGVFPSQT